MSQIRGAVEGLPAITAWQAALLEGQEGFHSYQSDISSAFYLFELPRAWLPFLGFNVECMGEQINMKAGVQCTLACRVLPMGMHSSVSLMQEVSETILWQGQVRRGQPVPTALTQAAKQSLAEDRCFWQVYLDNLMGGENVQLGPLQKEEMNSMQSVSRLGRSMGSCLLKRRGLAKVKRRRSWGRSCREV